MALTTFRICEGNKERADRGGQALHRRAMSGRLTSASTKRSSPSGSVLSAAGFYNLRLRSERVEQEDAPSAESGELIGAATALIYSDLSIRPACPIDTAGKEGNDVRGENCLFKG